MLVLREKCPQPLSPSISTHSIEAFSNVIRLEATIVVQNLSALFQPLQHILIRHCMKASSPNFPASLYSAGFSSFCRCAAFHLVIFPLLCAHVILVSSLFFCGPFVVVSIDKVPRPCFLLVHRPDAVNCNLFTSLTT